MLPWDITRFLAPKNKKNALNSVNFPPVLQEEPEWWEGAYFKERSSLVYPGLFYVSIFVEPVIFKRWSLGTPKTNRCKKPDVSAYQVQITILLVIMEYREWLDSLIRYKENRKNESTSSVSREKKGARDRRTLVRLLACGMKLGPSDSLGSSFGRETVFPMVAVFNFMITGHIWCLCPGQEQSELSGVPVIFQWFYIHLRVPESWVCQSKHIQLHGIFFIYLEGTIWEVYRL